MQKPLIAVVFGSRSTEHDISVLTAIGSIIKPLELSRKYGILPVYIAKDGQWYAGSQFADIGLYQKGNLEQVLAKSTPVSLQFKGGLRLLESGRFGRGTEYQIDVVFPATIRQASALGLEHRHLAGKWPKRPG